MHYLTVRDFIERLSQFDPDLQVCFDLRWIKTRSVGHFYGMTSVDLPVLHYRIGAGEEDFYSEEVIRESAKDRGEEPDLSGEKIVMLHYID